MNWTEKSKEISKGIMRRLDLEKSGLPSSAATILPPLLEEAAKAGMAFECDNAVMPLLDKLNKIKDK